MLNLPFTLITGQDLGTSYSSLPQIGNLFSNLQGFGQANVCSYLNMATGNLTVETPKKKLPEMNGPLDFYFTYNSKALQF